MDRLLGIPYQLWNNRLRTEYLEVQIFRLKCHMINIALEKLEKQFFLTMPFVQISIIIEFHCETFDWFFLQFRIFELKCLYRWRIRRSWRCIMRCWSCEAWHLSCLTHNEFVESLRVILRKWKTSPDLNKSNKWPATIRRRIRNKHKSDGRTHN